MKGLAFALALVQAAPTPPAASPAPATQEAPLAFGAEAALVAVDVNVIDRRGRPVPGLGPEDFTLSVDGRPRRIVSVEYVASEGEPTAAAVSLPEGSATNEGAARGRLVLIAIDQGAIRQGPIRDVTLAADKLIDQLGPADRLGLVSFPLPGPQVEPTADHAKVRKALGSVVGRARLQGAHIGLADALAQDDDPTRWTLLMDELCPASMREGERQLCQAEVDSEARDIAIPFREHGRRAINSLRALFGALAGIEGPKTLVLISQGLYSQNSAELGELANAAAAARVTLYALRLERGGVDASQRAPSRTVTEDAELFASGLRDLAARSRGDLFDVTGTGEGVFERIARELRGSYLLGFEPEDLDRDGKRHAIKVAVRGEGLSVRARRSVEVPREGVRATMESLLLGALRSPFPLPDVPLRATTWLAPAPDEGSLRLLMDTELPGAAEATAGATVGFALLDERGEVRASGSRPAQAGRALLAADLLPGRYTLRLAAVDGRGRRGSLEQPVRAELAGAEGVTFAGLLLSETSGGTARLASVVRGGLLTAELPARVATGRLDDLEVRFEVADSEAGPPLMSGKSTFAAGAGGGGPEAAATLAVGVLPPGDYVARAVVTRQGRALARAVRGFRVALPAPAVAGAETPRRRFASAELAPLLPRFEREAALRPEVLGYFLDRMEALAGPPASPLLARARARARAGELVSVFDDLSQETHDTLDAAFLRGLSFLARGDLRAAEAQLRRALGHSSELVASAFFLGVCSAARGEDAQAIGAWQTTLVTEPDAPLVRRLLADAELRAGAPDDALATLDEERAAGTPLAGAALRRGLALAMRGDTEEALRALAEHLESSPGDRAALYVTLRLMFDAYARGDAESPILREPERFRRYARAYVAGGGPQREVVERWLKWLDEAPRPPER